MTYKELFELVASGVTIIAFGYSWWVNRIQRKDAKSLVGHIRKILDRLSTQKIGAFPNYLTEVERLISDSKESIEIMAMVCSHGSFTAPKLWDRVAFALQHRVAEAKENQLNVGKRFRAVLLYGKRENTFIRYHQLDGEQSWAAWKQNARNAARLGDFCAREGLKISVDELKKDGFVDLRYRENERVRDSVYRHFQVKLCPESMPMYLWIRDGEEAIFSIRTEDLRGTYAGVAIRTSDIELVTELRTLFDHYSAKSKLIERNSA